MSNKKKDSLKEIQQSVSILDKMFKDQALNELLYYRAVVKLAFEYSEYDFCDRAMVLLLKIPRSYYKDYLPDDLEKSSEYQEQCRLLVRKLKLSGYDVEGIKANMPSAKA